MPVPAVENSNSSESLFKGLVNFSDQIIVLLAIEKIFDQNVIISQEHHAQLSDIRSKTEFEHADL